MQSRASETQKFMGAKNTTAAKGGIAGLLLLTVIALIMCAVAAFVSGGPTNSPYVEDWLDWARLEPTASGVMLLGIVCAIIGVIGTFVRLLTPKPKKNLAATTVLSSSVKPAANRLTLDEPKAASKAETFAPETAQALAAVAAEADADELAIPEITAPKAAVAEVALESVPEIAAQSFIEAPARPTQASATVQPLRPDFTRRGALKFDAASLGAASDMTFRSQPAADLTPAVPTTPDVAETVAEAAPTAVEAEAPATPEERYSAEIITLHPQPAPVAEAAAETVTQPATLTVEALEARAEEMAAQAEPLADPIAAALLADEPERTPSTTPESDINAVISSAMRFIESPAPQVEVTHEALHRAMTEDAGISVAEAAPEASSWTIMRQAETLTEIAPSTETLINATTAPATPEVQAEERIASAVDKSLNLWPQTTRPIAADELKVRAAYLFYNQAPEVRAVFDLLSEGNVDVAASSLQTLANARAFSGQPLEAAELWRAFGALHMGRDDPKAMMAYEQVSALDPSDANIHLYLSRRYAMEGKTELMMPTLSRALMVINDAYTRIELLGHYGDLALKANMLDAGAQAFEELSQLQSGQASANPDNLQLRSAHAISVAKLAQIRELQGHIPQAAPLYRHAYKLLADLSARVPDHAGLRAMTANALKDATRLNA